MRMSEGNCEQIFQELNYGSSDSRMNKIWREKTNKVQQLDVYY